MKKQNVYIKTPFAKKAKGVFVVNRMFCLFVREIHRFEMKNYLIKPEDFKNAVATSRGFFFSTSTW